MPYTINYMRESERKKVEKNLYWSIATEIERLKAERVREIRLHNVRSTFMYVHLNSASPYDLTDKQCANHMCTYTQQHNGSLHDSMSILISIYVSSFTLIYSLFSLSLLSLYIPDSGFSEEEKERKSDHIEL